MSLQSRLDAMTEADRDAYLTRLWRSFSETEAHEMLVSGINSEIAKFVGSALSQNVTAEARAYSAGAAASLYALLQRIHAAAFSLTTSTSDYREDPATDPNDYDHSLET